MKVKRMIDVDKLIERIEHLPKEINGYSRVYDEGMIINIIEAEYEKETETCESID